MDAPTNENGNSASGSNVNSGIIGNCSRDNNGDSDSETNRDVHNDSDSSCHGCDNKHHNSTHQLDQQQWM